LHKFSIFRIKHSRSSDFPVPFRRGFPLKTAANVIRFFRKANAERKIIWDFFRAIKKPAEALGKSAGLLCYLKIDD